MMSRHTTFVLFVRPKLRWQYILSFFICNLCLLALLLPAQYTLARTLSAPGIIWPRGQVLPHFCCMSGPLDEISVVNLNDEQNILFTSLEGLVNRTQPRIYVQQRSREDATLWPRAMHLVVNIVDNPYALITKYSSEIAGIVIYDPAVPDTINLATTIAGVRGALVASPNEAAILASVQYHLPVLVDLRANRFPSGDAVYQYTLKNFWSRPQAEHRLLIGLPPGPSGLRDYAIATGATVVWLDAGSTTDPYQKLLLDSFYYSMAPGSSYVGWYPNEVAGVQETSLFGITSYAADLSQNLTILGAGSHRISHPLSQRATPVLRNKIYVALFMSDGDNVQVDQHLLATKWADPYRGSVPIGWTIDPVLVDMAPAILNYYWETATPNDELVAGPSGLGYILTDQLPRTTLNLYTAQSASYMSQAGVDIATVWNTVNGIPQRVGDSYAMNGRHHVLGITTQNRLNVDQTGPHIFDHSLYSLPMSAPYAFNQNDLILAILRATNGYNSRSGPRFLALQANLNSPYISPTTLYNVQQLFKQNQDIVFVGPEELFRLLAENHLKTNAANRYAMDSHRLLRSRRHK